MKIKLLFFASCRDATGTREAEIEVEEGITVSSLKDLLIITYPNIRSQLKTISVAVNSEYMNDETTLNNGDEIALIPPVSGGN